MEPTPENTFKPVFLTLKEVMDIHDEMVRRFGGKRGIRDSALLESSLTMPRAGIVGQYLHTDVFEMGAAYLFHFSRNRPFYSANDQTAVTAALVFLTMNGHKVHGSAQEIQDLLNAVVEHKADKEIVSWFLRSHSHPLEEPSELVAETPEPAPPAGDS